MRFKHFLEFRVKHFGLSVHGYVVAILTLATIHLTYLVTASQGYIDWCNPYWMDCVSISKTGRYGFAYILFKVGMIPAALLLGWFWYRCYKRLSMSDPNPDRLIPWLGWVGSLALIVYSISLGHTGDSMQLLRRFGVVLFMGLTFIVQVKVAQRIGTLDYGARKGKMLLLFSLLILALAIFSLFLDYAMAQSYDRIENAFEWWLIILLIAHLVAISWTLAHLHSGETVNNSFPV